MWSCLPVISFNNCFPLWKPLFNMHMISNTENLGNKTTIFVYLPSVSWLPLIILHLFYQELKQTTVHGPIITLKSFHILSESNINIQKKTKLYLKLMFACTYLKNTLSLTPKKQNKNKHYQTIKWRIMNLSTFWQEVPR